MTNSLIEVLTEKEDEDSEDLGAEKQVQVVIYHLLNIVNVELEP